MLGESNSSNKWFKSYSSEARVDFDLHFHIMIFKFSIGSGIGSTKQASCVLLLCRESLGITLIEYLDNFY